MSMRISDGGHRLQLLLKSEDPLHWRCVDGEQTESDHTLHATQDHGRGGRALCDDRWTSFYVTADRDGYWVTLAGETFYFNKTKQMAEQREEDHSGFAAPMPGKIIQCAVEVGAPVAKGDVLVVMEAMKMEHRIEAPSAGSVTAFHCAPDDLVDMGHHLLDFEPDDTV